MHGVLERAAVGEKLQSPLVLRLFVGTGAKRADCQLTQGAVRVSLILSFKAYL